MSQTIYNFEKLDVWKISMDLTVEIYKITANFPAQEKFSLTSQIRRAVTSINLNIAEGSSCKSKKEFARFVNIAIGSLVEVKSAMILAQRLQFIDKINLDFDLLFFKLRALQNYLLRKK